MTIIFFYLSNSIKKLNKLVIKLQTNKKVIFKSKQTKFESDLKIKLYGKRIYPTQSVKYLGVKIDTNLSWQYHINDLSIKLNRPNALLVLKY